MIATVEPPAILRTGILQTMRTIARGVFCLWAVAISASLAHLAQAEDWPTWRHDTSRGNSTSLELADELHPQWVRQLETLAPAWPDQPKLDFERSYQPIVVGQRLIVPSPRNDRVVCYSTRTGEEQWVFRTDGPVRFAPVAYQDKLYFGCDDGFLYCLTTETGQLEWKLQGGPGNQRVLGNARLISAWPVRGAPTISEDGVLYFAASIWPFMGVFIHAVDANSGEVLWTNDGDGSMYILQPHNSNSFAGVAPQGPLVIAGDKLLIPSGRSTPACYDRHSGKLVHFNLAKHGKRGGGWQVACAGQVYFNGGQAFDLATGSSLGSLRGDLTFNRERLIHYHTRRSRYQCLDLSASEVKTVETKDRKGKPLTLTKWSIPNLWDLEAPGGEAIMIAGSRLYGATVNRLIAFDLPEPTEAHKEEATDSGNEEDEEATDDEASEPQPTVAWEKSLSGTPACLLAADDRLFVVTHNGSLLCFGAEKTDEQRFELTETELAESSAHAETVSAMFAATDVKRGYGVCFGLDDGQLVIEMLRQEPSLTMIVIDPRVERVDKLRDQLVAAGWYGTRASVHVGDLNSLKMPSYLARIVVSEDPEVDIARLNPEFRGLISGGKPAGSDDVIVDPSKMKPLYAMLRPYGGTAWIHVSEGLSKAWVKNIEQMQLESAAVQYDENQFVRLTRKGPIPGAANWTHEHADSANTRVSKDRVVRAPLGILWFGGTSHEGVLPRHGHGPQPQVVDGRAIVEGVDMMRSIDIYTGRSLWQRELPDVGVFYDFMGHQPGANGTGTNFVSMPDGIYVAYGNRCLRLDPATGETLAEIPIPDDEEADRIWGYINVSGDFLICGTETLVVDRNSKGKPQSGKNANFSASKKLYVMDRHSGELLWSTEAVNRFRHNAICADEGRLFAVDLLSQGELDRLKRRGEEPTTTSRLICFDLASGSELWSTEEGVFGTWLSYSAEHNVLVESGRPTRDSLSDEAKGMRAFVASEGKLLWSKDYRGPPIVHGKQILLGGFACHLLTGEKVMRKHPVTGEEVEWTWSRNYGCNTPMASQNLMTFRSGAAGYFDLANDGGTGNFGGFRSGCSNNLIVAGGVITVPDYTRTCACSYQNQTSVGLVPMADVEMWTQFKLTDSENLKHLGYNLGAPGQRRASDGLLWLNDYDDVAIEFDEHFGLYNSHSAKITGEGLPWVAASGCRGIRRLELDPKLNPSPEKPVAFTVRLHFCDPDNQKPGVRMFDVRLQGDMVLDDFDIVAVTGERDRGMIAEFTDVSVKDKLIVEFESATPDDASDATVPVLSGIEVIRQDDQP